MGTEDSTNTLVRNLFATMSIFLSLNLPTQYPKEQLSLDSFSVTFDHTNFSFHGIVIKKNAKVKESTSSG